MCRYAFKTYKSHFVCFDCRKAFKKPPVEDLAMQNGDWNVYRKIFWNRHLGDRKRFIRQHPELVKALEDKYLNRKEKCPDCGQLMIDLGLDFKAPKKDKVKEWKIIEGMYRVGITFHSCGCYGAGYVPKKKTDYIAYLKRRRTYYQQRLEKRDARLRKEDLKDYLARFTELIELIDLELEKIARST